MAVRVDLVDPDTSVAVRSRGAPVLENNDVRRDRGEDVTPELWVTLAVGLATPLSAVVVACMNRRRRQSPGDTSESQ